jgi:hypothetical protein
MHSLQITPQAKNLPASLDSGLLSVDNGASPCEAGELATAARASCVWLSISFCSETRKQLRVQLKRKWRESISFFLSVSNKDIPFLLASAHTWKTLLEFYFQLCFEELLSNVIWNEYYHIYYHFRFDLWIFHEKLIRMIADATGMIRSWNSN